MTKRKNLLVSEKLGELLGSTHRHLENLVMQRKSPCIKHLPDKEDLIETLEHLFTLPAPSAPSQPTKVPRIKLGNKLVTHPDIFCQVEEAKELKKKEAVEKETNRDCAIKILNKEHILKEKKETRMIIN